MTVIIKGGHLLIRPTISGPSSITGTVKVLSNLASRPVFLLESKSMKVVASTRSNAAGQYSFNNLATGRKWIVIGFDDSGQYNATIADRVQT